MIMQVYTSKVLFLYVYTCMYMIMQVTSKVLFLYVYTCMYMIMQEKYFTYYA